ncbi:hypothetical protein SLEP1_g48749 [Rubroshorea leprosula]|uniref:Uncharacterized protein n=1 Tax=Rubroshorea leprosula TaxID=152421 RepID=A0AAV5LUM6_9ROSI|nr:hypothetical protein SLEP1_g48749 [Rubroshorea leprosula]
MKMCEDKIVAQDKKITEVRKTAIEVEKSVNLQVHNTIENHIAKFLKFNTFNNIVNLYRLPTTILAFMNYMERVRAQHPKLDVTILTFGDQEGRVEENGENKTVDFRPNVKLK